MLNYNFLAHLSLSKSNGGLMLFVCFFLFVRLLALSCHSNYCAWSSRRRFDGKLNSVFSEQTDGALLQRDRLVKLSEGPVSVKRTWPLSCISMFAGAYKRAEKGFHYVTVIFKHIFCVQMFMVWMLTLFILLTGNIESWAKSSLIHFLSELEAGHGV